MYIYMIHMYIYVYVNYTYICQQVALAAEGAERDRADRFKDLETQAENAVKIEEAKEAAAHNATQEAQTWARREEVALAVAQTRLEQAHFEQDRQRDRMHAAEERANISRTVADSAIARLKVWGVGFVRVRVRRLTDI